MEQPEEIFAVCHVNDVIKRRAIGFVLARLDENGKAVPFPIVVARDGGKAHAYVNRCPHQGSRLDFEPRQFLDASGKRLICGKHGAEFEIATGLCVEGPCKGERLERVQTLVEGEDVCVAGVRLVEEDGLDRQENDETPEVVILPE